ncbi:MAG: response regulator [Candidatus Promineifilaceae bacterium]
MINLVKKILVSPTFEEEDKTRIAKLLHLILVSTLGVNGLFSVVLLLVVPESIFNLSINAFLFIVQLASFFLLYRGSVRRASLILVLAMWVYCSFGIFILGGARSPGIIVYFLVILIAGLLLGGRAALSLSALSVVAAVGLLYGELHNLLPTSLIPITPAYTWMATILGISVMAVLLHLATQSLTDALQAARRNAQALGEKNAQLEVVQAALEERLGELKQTEMALRTSEDRLRTVIDNAPIILWGVNRDGVLTFLEGKTLREIGFQPEDFVGYSVFEISDAHVPHLARQFQRALKGESVISLDEMRGRTFEMRYSPMLGGNGEVTSVIGIALDVTDRKRAEDALFQAQKLESLGVLAGGIAHDFNNLLAAMLGQSSVAQAKLSAEHPAYPHIKKAIDAANKAAMLTRQMLAYSGRSQFEIESINLNALIDDNIHLFQASIPKNVRLYTQLYAGLPLIEGDSGQMQQVIMNLILNAAEAIGQQAGMVTIETYPEDLDETGDHQWLWIGTTLVPGQYAAVEVRDDGCGMSETTVAKIFDPFFTTKETGHGLGLAAVLGIVRGHKGNIQVMSDLGHGTVFRLLFPVNSQPRLSAVPETPNRDTAEKKDFLILVIDDEEPVREAVTDILELEHIQVLTAADGQTGIDIFKANAAEIDLVLLDLSMPGLSGVETLQQLRKIDPSARILLSSGYDKQDAYHHIGTVEPTGFIQKPYSAALLMDTLWKYLPQSE